MTDFDFLKARIDLGLTQRELAAEAHVSLTTIQRLEGGGVATPRNAKRVADFLGVKVSDLMPIERQTA